MKSGASDPFSDEEDEEDETPPVAESEEGETSPVAESEEETTTSMVDESEQAGPDDVGVESDGSGGDVSGGTTPAESGGAPDGGADSLDRSQIPYTLRRNNVKDERPHVHQLFVTDDTDDAAREAERDLEDILGTDVYRLDAREAIYRIGMRHPEEVAELLEEWGYNF